MNKQEFLDILYEQLSSSSDDLVWKIGCHTDCNCCDHPSVHGLKCLNSDYDHRRCAYVCVPFAETIK